MSSAKLPDLGAAILVYLKLDTPDDDGLVGLTYNTTNGENRINIFLEWPSGKNKPIEVPPFRNCIIINTGRGGEGDIGIGLQSERVDIHCYGLTRRDAYQLWRRLDWYLCPPDRSRKTNFVAAHTNVQRIVREGGPIRLVDPSRADWPYVVGTYIFTYNGVPV